MSLFVQDEELQQQRDISFTASTNQITHLADIFTSITTINSQAIISIKQESITIYASYNHISNVHVTLDPSLFTVYNLIGDELKLGVDVNLIGECFNSVTKREKVNDSVICLISYQGEGFPLVIEFEDNLISEKLEFLTFYIDEDEEDGLNVSHEDIDMELIVKSDILYNLLQDLHQINTEDLYIYASNQGIANLTFISVGPIGTSKLIFPNEKTILEKIELTSSFVISKFDFINLFKITKAVRFSFKCKLLKDKFGKFSIQLLCKNLNMRNYSGTLIQFNMLEINHDEYMLQNIIQEESEVSQDNDIPMNIEVDREELDKVDVQRTIYQEVENKSEPKQISKVGGAIEIPLFL